MTLRTLPSLAALALAALTAAAPARDRWTPAQATAWEKSHRWLVGCNFAPSTAINQLEMWQAETWDPKTIDRELALAEGLGFTSVRVFLHDILWQTDSKGLLTRMEEFLTLADKHHIGVMFVPLDGVWDPFPKAGLQREPKPFVHNSGWVQSPGADILKDPARHDSLKPYITGVISHFKDDKRIDAWDIFNEPDNPNVNAYGKVELKDKAEMATLLLKKAFAWAREAGASQPVTSGVWIGTWPDDAKLKPIERVQIDESDIISFHNYAKAPELKQAMSNLRRYGRPVLCTEFMARPQGSTFDPNLGVMKEAGVAAYCWGFVAGKTQTNFPWDTWTKTYTGEPDVWFHEIFRKDGTPYRPEEVAYIRKVTGK